MPGLQIVVDPGDAELAFTEANGFNIFSPLKHGTSQREVQWGANADSEGDLAADGRDLNTEIPLRLRIFGFSEKQFRQRQIAFEQKLHKLSREGGTLHLIYPDGSWIDWEIRAVTGGERLIDNRFVHHKRTEDEITFVCAPFGEGEEVLVGEFEGEAQRVLECVVDEVPGSAPALARMEVTSPDADIWELKWGKESRRLSEAPTALSGYAATALTPLGGATATTATVDGKASTPVVRQGTLSPNWTAMLSTHIAGVGHMTQEGVYEILAWVHMPATNTGEVGIGFELGVGDLLQRTELDPIYFPANHSREGKVVQVVLGQAFLRSSGRGGHQWEGRVLGSSTVAGDDLDVLEVGLRPLAEGNGRIVASSALNQPAALLSRDEFNQSSGNLNGKTLAAAGLIAGPKSPSAVENVASSGTIPWTTPSNAATSDNAYAVASVVLPLEGEATTHVLRFRDFKFSIPVGAAVTGVGLDLEFNCSHGPILVGASTKLFQLRKSTGLVNQNQILTFWATSDTTFTLGGPGNLLGPSLTPAEVNHEAFGFDLQVSFYDYLGYGETIALAIDAGRLTIHYEDAEGQKWSTTGDAVDLAVETTGKTAQRSEVSDADINTGRYAVAGATVSSDVVVGVKAKRTHTLAIGERIRQGALARYIDTSNWLFFGSDFEGVAGATNDVLRVVKRVGGTVTELNRVSVPLTTDYLSFWLKVDSRGRYQGWGALLAGGAPRLLLAGQDNDLASGGALDDGKTGFYDAKTGASACTRNYDQFVTWTPPLTAAIDQGRMFELSHNACRRQVSGGAWAEGDPEGDYLLLEPGVLEHRKNRIVLVASPHDPELMGVGVTPPKLNVKFYAKPRYRTVPDPA